MVVSFPIKSKPDVSFLAWTTTPWTLPSNLALCVHPEYTYVLVEGRLTSWVICNKTGKHSVMSGVVLEESTKLHKYTISSFSEI